MKGFRPTGYGPSVGFKYPASMGFTGSTGSVTNVSPHVRRFAKGGYVRKEVGDPGSAMVRRAKPSTEADREYGGKSPLAPGFANGGKARLLARAMESAKAQPATTAAAPRNSRMALLGRAMEKAKAQPASAPVPPAGALSTLGMNSATMARVGRALARAQEERRMRTPTAPVKARFYDKGGKVVKAEYQKPSYWEAVKDRTKEILGFGDEKRGLAGKAAHELETRKRKLDERIDAASYSRGGKATRMGYADGGGVNAAEAKKIARRTVGEHVRYPAPKGHKGLKKTAQRC